MKTTIILDSNIFDKLIALSDEDLSAIENKYCVATTNVNEMELNRMPDGEKKERVLKIIQRCQIVNAKIFGFISVNDERVEDSLGGFSTYDSPDGGAILSYKDADILQAIGMEGNKRDKGRSMNDAAIVLAVMRDENTIFVTEEKRLLNKLRALGKKAISFEDFRKEALPHV